MRLRSAVEEKQKGAKKALWISEHYDRTLSTILVGNNFVNIGATSVATIIFGNLIVNPTLANIINTIVMTIIVLIFGEIMPKSITKENAEKIALRYANILYFIIKIMYPVVIVFIGIKKLFFRKSKKEELPTVTESELESIIDTMEEEGVIDSEDADLMQSVLDIGERTIYDIMIPRVDIIAVDVNASAEEVKNIFFKYKFSRVPVYSEDKDHIIGILSERDFYTALIKNEKVDFRKLIKEPLFVSKTMKVDDLIRLMQKEKKHMAIVSDEYGGTSGIVTMEDALEEIVGEIYDEHDDNINYDDIIKIADSSYDISADVSLEDLFDTLELGRAPDSPYTNVGGFLYSLAEEVPTENEVLEYQTAVYRDEDNDDLAEETILLLRFTILSVVERRILRTKLDIIDINNKASNTDKNNLKDSEEEA